MVFVFLFLISSLHHILVFLSLVYSWLRFTIFNFFINLNLGISTWSSCEEWQPRALLKSCLRSKAFDSRRPRKWGKGTKWEKNQNICSFPDII